VKLFRVFSWDGASLGRRAGGPLYVARSRQGAGRHDAPTLYGAWYCSRDAVSAVAESIQFLRGSLLTDDDFARNGDVVKALVELELDHAVALVDLDDASQLVKRRLRPSQVATLRRAATQRMAAAIYEEGAAGLLWWSTLEAEWTNVTLFHERVLGKVRAVGPPRKLSTQMPEVQNAAAHLGILT
jgi:RES domain